MKYVFAQLLFLLPAQLSFSQTMQAIRYRDKVFDKVSVQKNIEYATGKDVKRKYRRFDFYEPTGDSSAIRPLIIWMHGGGFKFGSKNSKEIKIWGNEFAQRGYAFAAINYRLSKKRPLFKFNDLVAGCADAVTDTKKAIQFFKQHYQQFAIDTGKIVLGGNSAGGMVALQTVYASVYDLDTLSKNNITTTAAQNFNEEKTAAIINFWGAIFNVDWLKRADVPIVSVHGRKDKTVPVDHKGTAFFGSEAIHAKADTLQIPNNLKIYEDYGHELQKKFNPLFRSNSTKRRWKEAAGFSAEFLLRTLFNNGL